MGMLQWTSQASCLATSPVDVPFILLLKSSTESTPKLGEPFMGTTSPLSWV